MTLLRSVLVGAGMSMLVSYLFGAQAQAEWDLLAINEVPLGGHAIHWSWPVFAVATIVVWLLQKVTLA